MIDPHNPLFERFNRLERAPYDEILVHQAGAVESLLRYVRTHTPPFAHRVEPLFDGDEFHPERWSELPILTRQDLREAKAALAAIEPPQSMGQIKEFSTSGSTGEPVTVRRNALAVHVPTYMRDRLYRWHDFDVNARLADINASRRGVWPEGRSTGWWSLRGPEGMRHNLSVFTPLDQQLDWLQRVRPRYLITLAMNLFELAEAAGPEGREIGIEATVATGSSLLNHTRELVAENFGASVIETYGSQEVGLIAIPCPESGLMHVCADHVIVEVLDDGGNPVGPGETGRIVVTSLFNYATPLLRYELGDLVQTADAPCTCGRTFPALQGVIGRIRKSLVFSDGTRVRPHAIVIAATDTELLPARQFQIVQTGTDSFEIRYVPLETGRLPDIGTIRQRFREMVHPAVGITLLPVKQIPRAANGKYDDFIYFDGGHGDARRA